MTAPRTNSYRSRTTARAIHRPAARAEALGQTPGREPLDRRRGQADEARRRVEAGYAQQRRPAPERVGGRPVHKQRTLVDTLGCGTGAFDGEPASIARCLASQGQGSPPARILGTSQRTSTDLAAFANTVLVRYLDGNDTYAARGPGHPSDMIPAVLAVADGHRAGGRG